MHEWTHKTVLVMLVGERERESWEGGGTICKKTLDVQKREMGGPKVST